MTNRLIDRGARLLARWLALEVVVEHEEDVALGRKDGTLAARLGVPVMDAHTRYRESIPRDLLEKTDYFREAMNEIVAGGQKVF